MFLKEVSDPERFGVAELDGRGKVKSIEEKPKIPKSNYAVTGLYLYDNTVFDKIKNQKLSPRGEYEITDINNKYIKEGKMRSVILKKEWFDIGTFDSLLDAAIHIRSKKNGK